jgi:hypothetical protein
LHHRKILTAPSRTVRDFAAACPRDPVHIGRSRYNVFVRCVLRARFERAYIVCMARKRVFAIRLFTTEERKLKRVARALGYETPTDYLRACFERDHEALSEIAVTPPLPVAA